MIKGRATIQFFDEKTGEVVRELHEENMITNAVDTILNPPDYIEIGMDSDNDRSFNMLRDFVGNIADTAFRGIIVCRDKIPEDGNNMMLPWTNEEIGHAGISKTSTDKSIGTYNANESGRIENGKGYRHVWDFASDRANGEIGCICLTTKDGGTCGYHDTYWNLSTGGTDLNSSSVDTFRQAFHTIVGRHIPDSQFNCGLFKWFYMGRLANGNVRLLGKHIHDCGIYEVILFDPMSISVSTEKPFCGIVGWKKIIELFPISERIPNSVYDNSYHHGSYYYDCNTNNVKSLPTEETEKMESNWESNPQWLAFFPYVIGDKIHIVATSLRHIHHYIFDLNTYAQVLKKVIETDVPLQNYGVGLNCVYASGVGGSYRWFYGTGVNSDYDNVLSAFEWDDKYFVITKYPLIDGKEAAGTNNFGQLRIFTKDGKSTGKILQYVGDGSLSNMTAASFWGFYVDEKTNTPLLLCDSCNISYGLIALEIIKRSDGYGWYRMRMSAPTYGISYLYSYCNFIKTEGLSLPLYILPYYPYSSSNQHFFGFALGICKLCLTTINNLSEPVRKLDGQVMKITYDIVDEEG